MKNKMIVELKVSLPWYLIATTGFFSIIVPIIVGCNTYEEVGIVLQRNISFLSIFMFANTYYIEYQQKTVETFFMLSNKWKKRELYKRIMLRLLFLLSTLFISYFIFSWKGLHLYAEDIKEIIILEGIFAIISATFFFGGICYLIVNMCGNIWGGIGCTIILWLILNSGWATVIPAYVNVFAYGRFEENWIQGEIWGLVNGIIFFFIGGRSALKSPYKF